VAAAYWPGGVGTPLNFYGGVRYTGVDDKYSFSLGDIPVGTRRNKSDYVDALVGVCYRFDLAERWSLLTRGDVSFGYSEGTGWFRACSPIPLANVSRTGSCLVTSTSRRNSRMASSRPSSVIMGRWQASISGSKQKD
jgi:hypothetical protein